MIDTRADRLSAAEVAAIEVTRQQYIDAWIAGDRERVMDTLTVDAVLIPHHGVRTRQGHPEIRQFWWPADAPPSTIDAFSRQTVEIGGRSGLAYARGRFHLEYSWNDGAATHHVVNDGNDLMILREELDGRWRISHHMWGDPEPR